VTALLAGCVTVIDTPRGGMRMAPVPSAYVDDSAKPLVQEPDGLGIRLVSLATQGTRLHATFGIRNLGADSATVSIAGLGRLASVVDSANPNRKMSFIGVLGANAAGEIRLAPGGSAAVVLAFDGGLPPGAQHVTLSATWRRRVGRDSSDREITLRNIAVSRIDVLERLR
jgi:hypothetical protein